jgi:hypothetical protein
MKRFTTLACGTVLSFASVAPAFAQSSVTLYGVLDNGFVYQNSGGNNSLVRAVPGGRRPTPRVHHRHLPRSIHNAGPSIA